MANQGDLMMEAAKMAAKQAAKKALMSAGAAIAPYAAAGCLIILGVVLFVLAICIIFILMLYITCNDAPNTIKYTSWIAGMIPFAPGAQEASMLGEICDIFKE